MPAGASESMSHVLGQTQCDTELARLGYVEGAAAAAAPWTYVSQ